MLAPAPSSCFETRGAKCGVVLVKTRGRLFKAFFCDSSRFVLPLRIISVRFNNRLFGKMREDYGDDDDDTTKGGRGKEAPVFFTSLSSKRRERIASRLMTGGSLSLKKNTNNADDEKEDLEETLRTNVLRLRRVRVPTSALFDAANNESFEEEEEGENNLLLRNFRY